MKYIMKTGFIDTNVEKPICPKCNKKMIKSDSGFTCNNCNNEIEFYDITDKPFYEEI